MSRNQQRPRCRSLEEMRALRRPAACPDNPPALPLPVCQPRQPSYLCDIRPTCVVPQPAQVQHIPLTNCLHAPYSCNTHRHPQFWCHYCLSGFLFPEQQTCREC